MDNNEITYKNINSGEFEIKITCKNNSDSEYRNACLKAYVCSILDMPPTQFDDIIKNPLRNKEAFIELIKQDVENRLNTFL